MILTCGCVLRFPVQQFLHTGNSFDVSLIYRTIIYVTRTWVLVTFLFLRPNEPSEFLLERTGGLACCCISVFHHLSILFTHLFNGLSIHLSFHQLSHLHVRLSICLFTCFPPLERTRGMCPVTMFGFELALHFMSSLLSLFLCFPAFAKCYHYFTINQFKDPFLMHELKHFIRKSSKDLLYYIQMFYLFNLLSLSNFREEMKVSLGQTDVGKEE